MSLLSSIQNTHARPKDAREAAKALEANLWRQLLKDSGAFQASKVAGGAMRKDLFIDALADAVAGEGILGLDKHLPTADRRAVQKHAAHGGHGHDGGKDALLGLVRKDIVAQAKRVSSEFGHRHDPFGLGTRMHSGVDIAAPKGARITSPAGGVVRRVGYDKAGYGHFVEVSHANGQTMLYAHADRVLVKPGQQVRAGQELATVGSSGRSTGPHLHLEVRQNGRAQDPRRALTAYGKQPR